MFFKMKSHAIGIHSSQTTPHKAYVVGGGGGEDDTYKYVCQKGTLDYLNYMGQSAFVNSKLLQIFN